MLYKLAEPVSLNLVFDAKKGNVFPRMLEWRGRSYNIIKVGLHHTYREGRVLYHVFSVASNTLFFRLVLNTENLHWKLEEISDGMPD